DGHADASAPQGTAGTLLLDPGSLTVADVGGSSFNASGADSVVAAGTVNNVLRQGTSVVLQADDNITVDAQIDGRAQPGGLAIGGAGLTMDAGGAVAVNKSIVLNGGAFNVARSGSFTQAGGTVIATLGSSPITIASAGNIGTQALLTSGSVALSSANGNITANQALGGKASDGTPQPLGSLTLSAANGVVNAVQGIRTTGDATFGARTVQMGEASVGGTVRVAAGSNLDLLGDVQAGGFVAGASGAPIGSLSMSSTGGKTRQLDAGAGGVEIVASSVGALGTIRSQAGIGLSATGGNVVLGNLESTGGGAIRVGSASGIELPANASIQSYGGQVALTAGGGIQAFGTIAANNPDPAAPAQAAGTVTLAAGGDLTVNQLVARGSTDLSSTAGAVTLQQALGGDDAGSPLLGSLRITAGKDVTIEGLNLAGDATPGADGLRVEAGTAGQGGRIVVNERIGVSRGNLQFGPGTPTTDATRAAVLSQGVYARTGSQDIRFNVPVIADGTRINDGWRALLPSANPASPLPIAASLGDQLVDMLLIPVEVGNDAAARLVAAGGGLRVTFDPNAVPRGRVVTICPLAGCAGNADYWMVPKVVISNQETAGLNDPGVVRLDGGIGLAERAAAGGPVANASIKVIVPMSVAESAIRPSPNPASTVLYYRQFEFDIATFVDVNLLPGVEFPYLSNGAGQLNISHLSLGFPSGSALAPYAVRPDPMRDLQFFNGVAQVEETTGSRTLISPGDIASIAYVAYPGRMGDSNTQLVFDGSTILPNGTYGFNSNSTPPPNFTNPQVGGNAGVNLAARILAALPPAATDVASGPVVPVLPVLPVTPVAPVVPGVTNPPAAEVAGATATAEVANTIAAASTATEVLSGETIASVAAIESRAGETPVVLCAGRARQVVGRTAGDEVDVGTTTALRGATRSVFQTTYALGQVAPALATADGGTIAGTGGADPCL
ncbi:hypothetical protein, partial [Variovorax sp. KK3]